MNQSEIDQALTTFRESFPYTKMTVLDDSIIYTKIPFGYNETIKIEAQELIDRLSLPLIAKTISSNGLFSDCVLIEIKND